MKKRVIVIIDRYLPLLGGAQNNVHEICLGLQKAGHKITVLTRIVFPGLKKEEVIEGVTIKRFAQFPIRIFSKYLFIIQATLFCITKKRDYDLILCIPCAMTTELMPPFFASFFTKKPYLIRMTCYDNFDVMFSWKTHSFPNFLKRIAFPPCFWRGVVNRASKIIALSEVLYEKAKEYQVLHCQVIPSGVDMSRFRKVSNEKERRKLRERLDIPENKIVILTIGRYVEGKNQDLLIHAAEVVEKEMNQAQLYVIILGATEEGQITSTEQVLKKYVKERGLSNFIDFRDDVINVEDYYQASDMMVHPTTFSEGLSRVIIEAMASGLPIICSNIPQNISIFPKGEGIFFDPDNPSELSEKIENLTQAKKERHRYGSVLASFAQENYSSKRVAEEYGDLLKSFLT